MAFFPPQVRAYQQPTRPDAVGAAPEPDVPSLRSPRAFVRSILAQQKMLLAISALSSLIGFLPGALSPYFMSRAIDEGILAHSFSATLVWSLAMLGIIVVGVFSEQASHALTTANWLNAMYRVISLVNRKVNQMGHVIIRRVPTGELLSVTSSDSDQLGAFAEVVGRLIASIVIFAFVTVVVLRESLLLGVVVLLAAPALVLTAVPLLRPLQRAQATERERSSILTGMATDIVAGLRILRGIGGEQTFGDNYAHQSQRVRFAGVRAQTWFAGVDSMRLLLSGMLLVTLTWLGTRELLAGRLSTGQLIGFFGYALFLVTPMATFYEAAMKYTQTLVGANKVIGTLSQQPPWRKPASPTTTIDGQIVDEVSGVVVEPGQLTILVSAVPDDTAAIIDRIGRYLPTNNQTSTGISVGDGLKRREANDRNRRKLAERNQIARRDEALAQAPWQVKVNGVDLTDTGLALTRQSLMVSDAGSAVFSGTLQSLIDPKGTASREQAEQALLVASAEDVWEALPGGWQGRIDERGRGLSGGQRQRMVLARALLANPPVLLLVEPTSAVDAHTEARIAERLPQYRAGRTTVLTTVSPLWLHHGDKVVLVVDGRAVAAGTHAQLMASNQAYRSVVVRGEDTL